MRAFRAGRYQKSRIPRILRGVTPTAVALSIAELPPAELARMGKKLVLLDVDNTLVGWRSMDIPAETRDWVRAAIQVGLSLCIISNTRNPRRLEALAKELGIRALRGKFKPNPAVYHQAMREFRVTPEQTVMLGDQLFTDVLGANRAGIEAIWIQPMTNRDFVGTKISRMGERFVRRAIDSRLDETTAPIESLNGEDLPASALGFISLFAHPAVQQFVKFGIVGGTSFIIDAGIHWLLMFWFPIGDSTLGIELGKSMRDQFPAFFQFAKDDEGAASPILKVISASAAIINSFIWNRHWTFGIRESAERSQQLQKFILVSLMGMVLNALIVTGLYNIVPGHPKRSWAVATVIATLIVAFWNFFGQKLFAFRRKEAHP